MSRGLHLSQTTYYQSHTSHTRLDACLSLSFFLRRYHSRSSAPSDSSHPFCAAASAPLTLQRRSKAQEEKLARSQLGVNTPLVGSMRCFKLRKKTSHYCRVHFNRGAAFFTLLFLFSAPLIVPPCILIVFTSCFSPRTCSQPPIFINDTISLI